MKSKLETIKEIIFYFLDYLDKHRCQGRIWTTAISMGLSVAIVIFTTILSYQLIDLIILWKDF